LSVCLSIWCLSVCLPVCLCLSIYLSIYLSMLTSFADERQQEVAVGKFDFVILQHRALSTVIMDAVTVDPRLPHHVVVVLELRHQLSEVALMTLRVTRPCQPTAKCLHTFPVTLQPLCPPRCYFRLRKAAETHYFNLAFNVYSLLFSSYYFYWLMACTYVIL